MLLWFHFGASYEQNWSILVSFSVKYWVKGTIPGAIKKFKILTCSNFLTKTLFLNIALELNLSLKLINSSFVQSWGFFLFVFFCTINQSCMKGEKELWKWPKWFELWLLLPWMEICCTYSLIIWFRNKLSAKLIIFSHTRIYIRRVVANGH